MPSAAPRSASLDGTESAIAPFSCSYSNSGQGVAFVRPAGELDIAAAPQLDQTLVSALRGARLVVLDISQLEFLDSCGVHLIAAATSAARSAGRRMITVRGPGQIRDIFALTQSEDDVELYDSAGSDLFLATWARGAGDERRLSA